VKVAIFYNKAIEEGDGSYRLFLFQYDRSREEKDSSLSSPFLLQQNQNTSR